MVGFGSPNSTFSALSTSTIATTSSSFSSFSSSSKTLRLWTIEEDQKLLDTIAAHKYSFAWPKIAEAIPGRSGKQCRERYLNHLKPSLKFSSWSALEDATVFHLYNVVGSRWSRMTKFLPGRTDNSIKNRFHHLRRRFEKTLQSAGFSPAELIPLMNRIKRELASYGKAIDPLTIKYLALKMLKASKRQDQTIMDHDYKFGPFHGVVKSIECERCSLTMPSKQTGRYVCIRSGWCQSCTQISPVISSTEAIRAHHAINAGKAGSFRLPKRA